MTSDMKEASRPNPRRDAATVAGAGARRSGDGAEAKTRRDRRDGDGAHKTCRVLAVDDHQDTVRILSRLLGPHFTLETADCYASAMRLAERKPFDVLLSDIELPDGSGLDLMRELRARHGTQGIAVSGHGGEAVEKRSLEAGFAEHLTKPVTYDQLYGALQRLCAKRDAA